MAVEVNKPFYKFNNEMEVITSVDTSNEHVSLFSIAEDNRGDGFFQQELAARVAHMANAIEDKVLHQSLQEDLILHISSRQNN
mmetsp:Transcript_24227/g.36843  ORF Transcript_24227/g.36843 Transcript_24227/m.36843 type:complete len:83 (+) Transcript_24227:527-775(+)